MTQMPAPDLRPMGEAICGAEFGPQVSQGFPGGTFVQSHEIHMMESAHTCRSWVWGSGRRRLFHRRPSGAAVLARTPFRRAHDLVELGEPCCQTAPAWSRSCAPMPQTAMQSRWM